MSIKTGIDELDDAGGPAFSYPVCAADGSTGAFAHPGMTLRDWFAGMYLSGATALDFVHNESASQTARHAYEQADAMLAARKQEVQP